MRTNIIFFIVSILLMNHAWSAEHPGVAKIKKLSLVNGCKIYNFTGNWVKSIPGNICLFTDDGTVISSDDKSLRRYNKSREVMWEIPGHFHHQMNFSNDKSRILALSSEIIKEGNENIRYDTLLIVSLDGKILHQISARELLHQTQQKRLAIIMSGAMKNVTNTSVEGSHFNSIYEIPEVSNKNVPGFLRQGNIIVNSLELGLYVLSADLQKVLTNQLLNSSNHSIHDVQVKNNGHLLLFNNRADNDSSGTSKFSAIQEIDFNTKKIIFEYSGNDGMFYSPFCGGVQELDSDLIGFSHVMTGVYFYSKSAKKLIATVPGFTGNEQLFYPTQQIKGYNLDDFLKNWEN